MSGGTNKVPMALEELHRSENQLAADLLAISDRHKADHEVHHVARDIAAWSVEHVREIARVGRSHGLELDPEASTDPALLAKVRQKADELMGRHHETALLLLADLRKVHRDAAGVSLDWEVLAQTAQALKDTELLELAQGCHPQTLRQMRWANAKLKESAAQVMVT
jgi:hypothetical protein